MYTQISDLWKYKFVDETDRSWLEEVISDTDEYTVDQAIEFSKDERVPVPDKPPWPSFYISRIYYKEDLKLLWSLTKIESNVEVPTSFIMHPDYRGQGLTHEFVQRALENTNLQNWHPKHLIWNADKARFNSPPSHYHSLQILKHYENPGQIMKKVTRR
jgi:hypothetical protein